jgi:hypothetical protein
MTGQDEMYKRLLTLPVNHMGVAQAKCGCCLHPQLEVILIGGHQAVRKVSDFRHLSRCREHTPSTR